MNCRWRDDIASLTFQPAEVDGLCVVHRRALETLAGTPLSATACQAYFHSNRDAFQAAAAAKIARARLAPGAVFHLTSRDIKCCRTAVDRRGDLGHR